MRASSSSGRLLSRSARPQPAPCDEGDDIAERGEDGSTQHREAIAVAAAALSDSIAQDEAKNIGETNWYAW